MCEDCRGAHKHFHWLTYTHYADLEGHVRLLTHRDDQIQSIMTWWQDTRQLYKDVVSPITGAPLSVAEAWRDAQLMRHRAQRPVSEATAATVARVQAACDDPALSDKDVMRVALREIDGLVSHVGTWPETPAPHSAEEVRQYVEESL